MLCPRCQIDVTDGQCPSCGIVWDAEYQSESASETAPEKTAIQGGAFAVGFEMLEPRTTEDQPVPGWREELKRRIEEHSSKTKDDSDLPSEPAARKTLDPAPQPKTAGEQPSAENHPNIEKQPSQPKVFDYRLKKTPSEPRKPLVNPVRHKDDIPPPPRVKKDPPADPLMNRHLVRGEGGSEPAGMTRRDRPLGIPSQGRLNLEPARPGSTESTEDPEPAKPKLSGTARTTRKAVRASREVLFSRFLAGVVDLSLPLALGVAFSLAAAWRVGFDFFTPESIQSTALLSLGFYFFNSSFFLLLAGQTPGMYVAQLVLVSSDRTRDVPPASTMLRVLFFIPSALSVIGLVWGTIDSECRCLHDILSGTQIAPAGEVADETSLAG